MTSTLSRIGTLAQGLGLSGSTAIAEGTYRGYELPPYTVEARFGAAELRAYAPHPVAEVTVAGDRDAALQQGFRILARYIFGANDGGHSVAMTAPVAQSRGAEIAMTSPVAQAQATAGWTIAFTMPASHTPATLPRPDDPAIRIVETDPVRRLVLAFPGRATDAQLAARTAELRAIAEAAGFTVIAGPAYFFYDDPFTLPWNRRNEVAFDLG